MDLSALLDALTPGPGGRFDQVSAYGRDRVQQLASTDAGRPVWTALHGNRWLGHPLHPVVVTVPIGAWTTSAWHDARSAVTGDPRDEHAADVALRVGVVGALAAAATGIAQYADTRGTVRRQTTLHSALNGLGLALYVASWAARRKGRRPLGRTLSAAALAVVGVSGYVGGDISYRHGVGVRPQAVRDPGHEPQDSSERPLEVAGVRHL